MATQQYTDWRSWWDGLRTNLFKCVGTAAGTWLTTNALASTGVMKGIDWEQMIGFFVGQMALEIFLYMKTTQPTVVTETVDTTFTAKTPSGGTVVQSSTTTTPVPPAESK